MADANRTVTVNLRMDVRDYKRMLREVDDSTKQTTANVGRNWEQTGERMSRIGDRMSVAVTAPLALLGKAALDAASDLEQSVGAVESVFGSAGRSIEEFGRTAADALGLSRREVNETAAVLGASLQSMGFEADEAAEQVIRLQERAADMAATFGGSTRDALDAIASLMRGERDPIERYGVAIKQVDINAALMSGSLDGATAATDRQAEAQAALSLLMEQTSNIQGQFAREADTVAGAQQRMAAQAENARAQLGEALLPVMTRVYEIGAAVAEAFGSLPPAAQTAIVAMGGIAAAAGPLLSIGGRLLRNWDDLTSAMGRFRTGAEGVASFLRGPWGAALAASAGYLINFRQEADAARQATERFHQLLTDDQAAGGLSDVDLAEQFIEAEVAAAGFSVALAEAGLSARDLAEQMVAGDWSPRVDLNPLNQLRDALSDTVPFVNMRAETTELTDLLRRLDEAINTAGVGLEDTAGSMDTAADVAGEFAAAIEDAAIARAQATLDMYGLADAHDSWSRSASESAAVMRTVNAELAGAGIATGAATPMLSAVPDHVAALAEDDDDQDEDEAEIDGRKLVAA